MYQVWQALNHQKYSTASDVWSYGVVMYEVWSVGRQPFQDYANSKVIFNSYQEMGNATLSYNNNLIMLFF